MKEKRILYLYYEHECSMSSLNFSNFKLQRENTVLICVCKNQNIPNIGTYLEFMISYLKDWKLALFESKTANLF